MVNAERLDERLHSPRIQSFQYLQFREETDDRVG